ncbi:uncharacterized protein LOC131026062 [Salvia miltiorrhiza]|uniref:uncharacterized protein LOC131026062 n=1 Tax=Salvia miltiorrhiza TaxID=226208 RepID=UPI0025ACF594|nr:uncharacterized protein LOC131026062 [Salvia miltiorrhiza]
MACKIDVTKAFDTLRWDFLLDVLKVGGYDSKFIRWIEVILHSAKLSILYNGQLCGYFGCSRGVRQGDPLSPILFGIAEDVLSALFHNCVTSGHFHPMKFSRRQNFPTHLFYTDDILVFYKATTHNAKTLKTILNYYGSISGQQVSTSKSHVFYTDKLVACLSPIWEFLFLLAELELLICELFMIVLSPSSLDGKVTRESVAVVRLAGIEFALLKRKEFGFTLLKERYLNDFCQARTNVSSTVWLGIQPEVSDLVHDSYSYIGNGENTNFWRDDWLGYRIAEKCGIPYFLCESLTYSMVDYFYEGIWHFTQSFINKFPDIICDILLLPIGSDSDTRFWKNSVHGKVTSALAHAHNCHRFPQIGFKEMEFFEKIGYMKNTWSDYLILHRIGVKTRATAPPTFISVHWWPPASPWIKVNTDGSAMGAPGNITAGGVFRDHFTWVRGCFHYRAGIGYAFEAELFAVIIAIQIAHSRGWHHLWIEADSAYVIHVTHIYREGNKPTDIMANQNMMEGWWPHEELYLLVGCLDFFTNTWYAFWVFDRRWRFCAGMSWFDRSGGLGTNLLAFFQFPGALGAGAMSFGSFWKLRDVASRCVGVEFLVLLFGSLMNGSQGPRSGPFLSFRVSSELGL